jgi:hypothetical protein
MEKMWGTVSLDFIGDGNLEKSWFNGIIMVILMNNGLV